MIRADQTLRVTQLSANSTEGFSTAFTINDLPFTNSGTCPATPSKSSVFCGTYTQPCRSDVIDDPPLDYLASYSYFQKGGAYSMVRTTYQPARGCDSGQFFRVEQSGSVRRKNNNNSNNKKKKKKKKKEENGGWKGEL